MGVFSNLLDRYFMLNKPKSKAPSQWPINLTKVFGISHNTPIPDTVSEKWNNETTKEVIKVRYTINITFTHSKENIDNYFLSAIYTTVHRIMVHLHVICRGQFFYWHSLCFSENSTLLQAATSRIINFFIILYIVLTICLLIG